MSTSHELPSLNHLTIPGGVLALGLQDSLPAPDALTPFEQRVSDVHLPVPELAEQAAHTPPASRVLGATAVRHTANAQSGTHSGTIAEHQAPSLELPSDSTDTEDDNVDIPPMYEHIVLKENSYKQYLYDIGKIPLLKPEQEPELGHAIEAGLFAQIKLAEEPNMDPALRRDLETIVRLGDQAKETLINANLRLVVSIAKRYSHETLHQLDFIQEGNMALMHAVRKFDYTQGYKFSTYATWWIRQAIHRCIFDQGRTIRLPTGVQEKIREVNKAKAALTLEKGRNPTDEEIAAETEVEPKKLAEFAQLTRSIVPLSQPISKDNDDEIFGNMVIDDQQPDPGQFVPEQVFYSQLADRIFEYIYYNKKAHRSLPVSLMHRGLFLDDARIHAYVSEHVELEPGRSYNFVEIGHFINRSRVRAQQLDAAGIKLLQALVRDFLER